MTDVLLLEGKVKTLSNGKVLHWNLYLSTGTAADPTGPIFNGYSYQLHADAMPTHVTIGGQSMPTYFSG